MASCIPLRGARDEALRVRRAPQRSAGVDGASQRLAALAPHAGAVHILQCVGSERAAHRSVAVAPRGPFTAGVSVFERARACAQRFKRARVARVCLRGHAPDRCRHTLELSAFSRWPERFCVRAAAPTRRRAAARRAAAAAAAARNRARILASSRRSALRGPEGPQPLLHLAQEVLLRPNHAAWPTDANVGDCLVGRETPFFHHP